MVVLLHPTGGWGGAELTTKIIGKSLKIEGIDFVLLTNFKKFLRETGELAGKVKLIPLNPWFGSLKEIAKDLILIRRVCKELKPTIIVGIMPYGAFLTVWSSFLLRRGVTSIVSPRGSCRFYLKYFVRSGVQRLKYRFFFKTAFGLADYFFSPSRLSTMDYIKFFGVDPTKCFLIPNGVRIYEKDFDKILKQREESMNLPQLLWVGRFSGEKFLEFIVKALSGVKLPFRLRLVGDGPDLNKIRRLVQCENLEKKVVFTGFLKDPLPIFLESHVYLHSCFFEEFGYSVAEALATGLPVVARNCPYGPREVLDYGRYGLLADDELEMTEMVNELLSSRTMWEDFSRRAIIRARDFDLNSILQLYGKMFRCIVNGQKAGY